MRVRFADLVLFCVLCLRSDEYGDINVGVLPARKEVLTALTKSAALLHKLLEKGLEHPAGRVPNFKPDVVAFVSYLIAHDSHHRGQTAMLARQIGAPPLPSNVSFGLSEWGTLWKETGLSR